MWNMEANADHNWVCVSQQVLLETVYSDTSWKVQTEAATTGFMLGGNIPLGYYGSQFMWEGNAWLFQVICACLDLIRSETVTV